MRSLTPATPPPPAIPEDEDVFVFPASAAQRRFWLLDQLVAGGNPALNMPLALRLRGDLQLPALERACNEVLRRHEALRTTFHSEKGQLQQVIAPRQTTAIPLVDVSDFPSAQRADVPAHLLAEEVRQPFDLARGPLFRLRLVRLSPQEHLLLCPMHHIVADGWSNGVFVRELGVLYAAFTAGRPSPLPELAVQFADFSQWQNTALASGGFQPQLDFWRTHLAGPWPSLRLPTDYPRQPWQGQPAPAAILERPLPAATTASLKTLAASEGVSPFMLFLAAFAVLLSRYSGGQENLVIGTSTANRDRLEVENLVGLFVNPLLLRLDLSGAPTFRELLSRTRHLTLEAFQNADVPFEKLIEELQPSRLPVNFLYQRDFVQAARWLDVEATPENAGTGGAIYEWNVLAVEDAAGVRLHCEYHAGLYKAETISRVLADYQGLLAAVAAGALDQPVTSLPLASIAVLPAAGTMQPLRIEAWRRSAGSVAWMAAHLPPAVVGQENLRLPTPGQRFAVLDAHLQPAPVGVLGELCLLDDDGKIILQTGDTARRQADGTFVWLGRQANKSVPNEGVVDCSQIEAALRAHPHLRQAVVLWQKDSQGRTLLTAYCQHDEVPLALVSPAQLHAFLRERLPEEAIPGAFVLLPAFPLRADGCLDEHALPVPVAARTEDADDYAAPYLPLHFQIIEIWREVLRVRSIGLRDDFFALGGNSLLAMRMLYRLEEAFGKALLPATLFRSATVEHLADEILRHAEDAGSPEVIAVQENGIKTPIFYLHGDISGGGFYCRKLSAGLGPDQPFYALAPAEIENPLEDRPTIEQMAARHVQTIRSVRPHGPYIVGGFCLGGLIAYEVASQLEREGEKVERLIVIDAGPTDRRLTALRRWAERVTRWRHLDGNRQLYWFCRWHYWLARWDRFRGLDMRSRLAGVGRRVRGILGRRRGAQGTDETLATGAAPTAWFDPRLDVPLVFLWAVGGYRPRFYAGAMTLLLSSDLLGGAEGGDPTADWRRLAPDLETREVRGNHLACITEHVDTLAATFRRSLERAPDPGSSVHVGNTPPSA